MIKKYGKPKVPEDIKCVISGFAKHGLEINFDDFKIICKPYYSLDYLIDFVEKTKHESHIKGIVLKWNNYNKKYDKRKTKNIH